MRRLFRGLSCPCPGGWTAYMSNSCNTETAWLFTYSEEEFGPLAPVKIGLPIGLLLKAFRVEPYQLGVLGNPSYTSIVDKWNLFTEYDISVFGRCLVYGLVVYLQALQHYILYTVLSCRTERSGESQERGEFNRPRTLDSSARGLSWACRKAPQSDRLGHGLCVGACAVSHVRTVYAQNCLLPA